MPSKAKRKKRPTRNKKAPVKKKIKMTAKIKVTENGPYVVTGGVPLDVQNIVCDEQGYATGYKTVKKYPPLEGYSLCRCGESSKQPFCDGSHVNAGYDGTETAGNVPYSKMAQKTDGPELFLTDAEEFCASARFCDRAGGTWNLTKRSDNPKSKKTAIQEATDCPAGRLVIWDKKTGKPIEPKHPPSITILEDPTVGASGPVWVKGGIPVESAEGETYEIRNRVTLCRCGASENKPFCDGNHRPIRFEDGIAGE